MKNKIERKTHQEKPEPQEIKFKFESGCMFFELGDRQYFLSEKQGREISLRLEQLRAVQNEDFSEMNTRDFMARFRVVYEQFGNLEETANFLKLDSGKLRRWMNQDSRQKKDALHSGPTDEFGKLKEAYRKEFFGPEEKIEERKAFNPDLKVVDRIARFLMKKTGPREIAEKLKVDYDSFSLWFTRGDSQRMIQNKINNEAR